MKLTFQHELSLTTETLEEKLNFVLKHVSPECPLCKHELERIGSNQNLLICPECNIKLFYSSWNKGENKLVISFKLPAHEFS